MHSCVLRKVKKYLDFKTMWEYILEDSIPNNYVKHNDLIQTVINSARRKNKVFGLLPKVKLL